MLDDSGNVCISEFDGPDGSEFDMVFNTDGEKTSMDRTPRTPDIR